MKSVFNHNLKLEIFGESHADEIGMSLTGVPAGIKIDTVALAGFMARRAPGGSKLTSARKESDEVIFTSGVEVSAVEATNSDTSISDDQTNIKITNGETITAIIKNNDARPNDYEDFKNIPRPGHADYTTRIKYGEEAIITGGGHNSGRMTAPLCIAGSICLQILEEKGIFFESKIDSIGGITDEAERIKLVKKMQEDNNSVGGIISLKASGVEAGLGDPMFLGMENRISEIMFAIPAVKGIEFGAGFEFASMTGFEANDEFNIRGGKIVTDTNNCGGILGGITDGMPLTLRVAFKPTPSIARLQKSVNLETMRPASIRVEGRHDPCIVLRARPIVEAAAAIAIYDAMLGNNDGSKIHEAKKLFEEENDSVYAEVAKNISVSETMNVSEFVDVDKKQMSSDDYLTADTLTQLRDEIDEVDYKLIKLFEERMDISKKIGEYKKSEGIKIADEKREKEKLKAIKLSSRDDLKKYTKKLYEEIFELSKKYQKKS